MAWGDEHFYSTSFSCSALSRLYKDNQIIYTLLNLKMFDEIKWLNHKMCEMSHCKTDSTKVSPLFTENHICLWDRFLKIFLQHELI